MVPEIQSETNRMFCHFGPFFAPAPSQPEKSKFEKKKKNPSDIIILQMCPIYDIHDVWFLLYAARDRQNLLSFWTAFCLFTPLTK